MIPIKAAIERRAIGAGVDEGARGWCSRAVWAMVWLVSANSSGSLGGDAAASERGLQHILLDDSLPHQRRTLLRLSGADVARFLQGLLSADIEAIAASQARPATVLTVKGKIVSELIVLRDEDGKLGLAVPSEIEEAVAQKLDRHVIMDDVELALDPAPGLAFVWGEGLTRAQAPSECGAVFETTHPAPGLLVVGTAEQLATLSAWAPAAGPEDFTRYRVASASPAWGHELRPDRFPPEVGFVHAVSYDKGCYMGQEPLSRIHARGQVNRVMVRVSAEVTPEASAEPIELSAESRPKAGLWTTWVATPGGGCEGLAIVHRSVAKPGAQLGAGELTLTVRSGPLGDDLGMGGRHGKSATVKLGRR